jgi:hypothetical protein
MAALNVRILIGHIDELRVLLATNPIDVLAINESWLDASIHDNEIHISDYEIVRRDRSIDSENVEYYILGDLNCDLGASVLDHNSRSLTDIADLYGMHQLINEPTRITESSSTIIDHIFATLRLFSM